MIGVFFVVFARLHWLKLCGFAVFVSLTDKNAQEEFRAHLEERVRLVLPGNVGKLVLKSSLYRLPNIKQATLMSLGSLLAPISNKKMHWT